LNANNNSYENIYLACKLTLLKRIL